MQAGRLSQRVHAAKRKLPTLWCASNRAHLPARFWAGIGLPLIMMLAIPNCRYGLSAWQRRPLSTVPHPGRGMPALHVGLTGRLPIRQRPPKLRTRAVVARSDAAMAVTC
jgi:hypothetical protein